MKAMLPHFDLCHRLGDNGIVRFLSVKHESKANVTALQAVQNTKVIDFQLKID